MTKKMLAKLYEAYTKIDENDLAKELVLKTSLGDYSIENKKMIRKILHSLINDIEEQLTDIDKSNEEKRSSIDKQKDMQDGRLSDRQGACEEQ